MNGSFMAEEARPDPGGVLGRYFNRYAPFRRRMGIRKTEMGKAVTTKERRRECVFTTYIGTFLPPRS